ncbi:hypothetical protein [Alteromonas sp. A079]|uniref:hypothetical protein n=1 Tax=Alteromonas sp. A079 TaxID=3410268 RepID=UPI003BA186FB
MKTLIIPKDLNPKNQSAVFKKVLGNPEAFIRMSSKGLKFSGSLGLESQVIQLLASWFRSKNSSKTIQTYLDYVEDPQLGDLCQSLLGMAYLTLCDNILLSDGETLLSKGKAFSPAISSIEKLQKLDFKNAFKGRKLFFPCLKPSKSNGLIEPLYQAGEISKRGEFKYIFQEALDFLLGHEQRKIIKPDLFINLATCVYELFKNTDDHSLRDEKGNFYLNSVRGINLNISLLERNQLLLLLGEKESSYINCLYNGPPKVTFLELSVVDTGIGYAKSWVRNTGDAAKSISINEEINAVLSCFEKHNTTKNKSYAGSGLTNVMDSLGSLNAGFILKTGHTTVSSFARNGAVSIDKNSIQIEDYELAGTSFTILVPLIFKDEY